MSNFQVLSAEAAVKTGATCTRLGQTATSGSIKFTCIKNGKKLVWNKGVKNVPESNFKPATPQATPSPSPTVEKITYFVQWKKCDEPTSGHTFWVVGKSANGSELIFLRCTTSRNEDGSPTDIWQKPEDGAKIDQTTGKAIEGTGYIPATYSNVIIHPDWYSFSDNAHATAPTSFANLFENRRGIAYQAWKSLHTAVVSGSSSNLDIEVLVGPNTSPYSKFATHTITIMHKMMSSNNMMKKVKVYYYNRADQVWASSAINSAIGATEVSLALSNLGGPLAWCYGSTDCNNAGAWTTSDGTGYIYMGVPNAPDHRNLSASGEAGEYFHAAWRYFYSTRNALKAGPSPSIFPVNQPPFWLNIAYEEIASFYAESDGNFRGYKNQSLRSTTAIQREIPNFDLTWMNEYLAIKNLGNRWSDAHSGAPNNQASILGPRIGEIFIALKGPSVILDFYDRMSRGESFEQAFEAIFKTTWSAAAPEIAKVIVDEFSSDY
jgi:hypothetical protein